MKYWVNKITGAVAKKGRQIEQPRDGSGIDQVRREQHGRGSTTSSARSGRAVRFS
jgi:hypothetical protein